MQKVQESKVREQSLHGTSFLFGVVPVPEYSELLASLPKRSLIDKLVSRYFSSYDLAIREYQIKSRQGRSDN